MIHCFSGNLEQARALIDSPELIAARAGSLLVVECTDPMAAIDLPNLVRETGDAIERRGDVGGALVFHIRKAA